MQLDGFFVRAFANLHVFHVASFDHFRFMLLRERTWSTLRKVRWQRQPLRTITIASCAQVVSQETSNSRSVSLSVVPVVACALHVASDDRPHLKHVRAICAASISVKYPFTELFQLGVNRFRINGIMAGLSSTESRHATRVSHQRCRQQQVLRALPWVCWSP